MSARAILAAIALSMPGVAQAADAETIKSWGKDAADGKIFAFDYGVPSSPGTTLLGIDKDKITQSNSLKPFVLSLPGFLSSQDGGKAIAFDASLGALIIPVRDQTFIQYASDYGRALSFRTRLNVALYEGENDDDAAKQKPSRAAIGLSSSLLNSSDPLLVTLPGSSKPAYIECLDILNKLTSLPDPTGDEARDAANAEAFKNTAAAKVAPTCKAVADLAARLGTDLDVGGGYVLSGDPGKLSNFGQGSGVIWASFRTSLTRPAAPDKADLAGYEAWVKDLTHWFMLGASGRAGFKETIATGDATRPMIRANTFTGWAGLEYYKKNLRFALQAGRQKTDPTDAADSAFGGTRTVYYMTYDQQLSDIGLWVSFSYGKASGEGALKSDSTARVTLSFGAPEARKVFRGL